MYQFDLFRCFFVFFDDLRFVFDFDFFIDRNLLRLEFFDLDFADLDFADLDFADLDFVDLVDFVDLDFDQRVFLRLGLVSDLSFGVLVLQSVLLLSRKTTL